MTVLTIEGERFLIDGQPTYTGRTWRGHRIEGLLFNSRMVQATFDDRNPATRGLWAYPDCAAWDPERNTAEFIDALGVYRRHGLLAVTINLQGGNPQGYRKDQPWINSAYTPDGAIDPAYLARLERVLDAADGLGMAVILGLFYFGQDQVLRDEAAVLRALDSTCEWILAKGYGHVLIEVNNECDVPRYVHPVLMPGRVAELIERVKGITRDGRRLLASTSTRGRAIPNEAIVRASDFLLIHGNGVTDPREIGAMVARTRQVPGYRPMPIVFNEDDHYRFDEPLNNMTAAIAAGASWGYLDCGENDYVNGYQSPPVNWGLATERKRAFFGLVREVTEG